MNEIILEQPYKYKDIWDIFGEDRMSGSAIQNQIKRWQKTYEMEKIGKGQYIFHKEYSEEEIKQNEIADKILYDEKFICENPLDYNKSGIYKIYNDTHIYIGETYNFRNRYRQHRNGYIKDSIATDILNSPSGKFEILALENDLVKRLELERCYIRDFNLQNKYECVNKQKNNKIHKKVIKVKQCDYDRAIKMLEKSGIEVLNG